MNAYDVAKWERAKEIAEACGVTWEVRDKIKLYDANGLNLGFQHTVDEAFAFLCGYEHSRMARDDFPMVCVRYLANRICRCKLCALYVETNYHHPECMVGKAQSYLGMEVETNSWKAVSTEEIHGVKL